MLLLPAVRLLDHRSIDKSLGLWHKHLAPIIWILSSRFVLLVSGLGLGGKSGESLLSMQLLVDLVTGQLGAEGEQCSAALISRIILAGNLLSQNTQSRDSMNKVMIPRTKHIPFH